jgi:hypothetical protein
MYNKLKQNLLYSNINDRIGVVMIGVLDSRAVDKGFEPRSGQVKGYNIGIGCFFNKHVV